VKTRRVIVWATGGVGRYAICTIADRPNLELAPAASRPREAREDFCRILESGKSIVTQPCSGHRAPAGPIPADSPRGLSVDTLLRLEPGERP
jgi:hypothetical protein